MIRRVLAFTFALLVLFSALAQTEPIEIRMWIAFTDFRLDWTKDRAAEFNALFPQYNVVVEGFQSYNTAFDATVLAAEQGNPPAITHFFEAATQEARDAVTPSGQPVFKSIAEAIAGRTEINGVPVLLNDVVSAAADYYTLDGEFTSMPWNTSTTVMFSNASMLEAAGIDSPPETWGELKAACEAILALPDGPPNCITWPNHSWFFEQSLAQQGALLANNGNGREARATEVFLNSQAAIDYVQFWADLNNEGYYVYTGLPRDWGGTQNAFESQQVAFLIFSSSDATVIPANTAENFTTIVSRMPYNEKVGYHGNIIGGATLWLNNGLPPEVEEGALTFMNWFINPENAASWHQTTGYIPITNSAAALLQNEGWFDSNPGAGVASEQLNLIPVTGALIGNFVAIRDVFTDAVEKILINNADVTATLNEANAAANELLSEYNSLFVPDN